MGPNEPMNHQPVPATPVHHAPVMPPHLPQTQTAPAAPAVPVHTPEPPQAPSLSHHAPVKSNNPLFTLGVASLIVVIIGWLLVSLLGLTRGSQAEALDKKLTDLSDQLSTPEMVQVATQYTTVETVLSQIKKLRADRLLFDPTWQTIKQNVPKDIQFTNFTLGDDGTFRLAGVGRSVTSVAQFAAALTQAGYRSVTPLAVDKQSGQELYNFSMTFKAGVGQ